jgi:hypothetical protein
MIAVYMFIVHTKTRAVVPFFLDARTFHNIYKLQKHVFIKASIISDSFYGQQKFTILAKSLVRSVAYGESEVKLFACKEIINRW